MRTALLLLAFLALPAPASQVVWKWVDGQGMTHYSDLPAPGAIRVDISSSNRSDAGEPATAPSAISSQPDAQSGPAYRNFEIWKPAQDESLINTGGQVTVNIRVDPALQPGHSLFLYLDSKRVEGHPLNAHTYDLKEVPRGEHRVIAVISNQRGVRVQESSPVAFSVRQESMANPPVGPALRTPPKPRTGGAANKLPAHQPSHAALNGAQAHIDPATNAPLRKPPGLKPTHAPTGD